MASYTDAITQFNPYVSQLPVEAMVKVGMQKQAQFEQGVQKIQSQIDQVAGLDVLRDVDKNYLQTKLNELGGKLQYVAAGDFSNFQLVNSVAGMTKQVAKDENIQNAVSSTAWYRKQQKAIEEARKQGKSGIENEDLFSTQASVWLNNNTPGASFSAEYIPFTDVFKKLGEIAKAVGEDSTIVQQLFQTDKDGNPVVVNGKLQYNDVMAETLLKGKDKNKILNAFQSGLDANDYRQLSITGRYKLKGRSKEELSGMLDEGFVEYQKNSIIKKDFIQDKILELKNNNGDTNIINQLQLQVKNIDENISKRKLSIDQLKTSDEDAIRSSIYTNNYLDSMSDAFSTKETYTKYLKNPGIEVMMDREKLKLDQNKFRLDQDKFIYEQLHNKEQMDLTKWVELFKAGLVDKNGKPTGAGLYSGAARDLGINDQENSLYFTEQFQQGLSDDTDAQFKLYEKVAIAHWMAINSGNINPNTGKVYTIEDMKKQIAGYAKKTGHSYNDYIVLQGQKATDNHNDTKRRFLGAEYNEDFATINALGNKIALSKKLMDGENDFIKANAEGFKPFDLTKTNIKPMSIFGINSKKTLSLNEADVIDAARWLYHNRTDPNVPRIFDSKAVSDDASSAEIRLKKKFGEAGFRDILNQYSPGISGLTAWQTQSVGGKRNFFTGETEGTPISNAIQLLKNNDYKKTLKLKEQYYKGISEVGVPKAVVLYKDKAEQKEHLKSSIASIVSDYAEIDPEYKELSKLAANDKSQFQINITPAASRYSKNKYDIQATDENGNLTIKEIKEKDFKFLTGENPPSLLVNEANQIINASPFNCTNLTYAYTDDRAHSTAFIKDDQTRTENYNVAIDYVKNNQSQYFPKIYVQIKNNDWKLYPYNVPITEQGVANFPSQVDDVFIKSLLSK